MQVVTPGNISYVISQAFEAVATVSPGETTMIETQDAWNGMYNGPEDMTPEKLRSRPRTNPVTGPVYVSGAEPGDMLAVGIDDIEPDSYGYTRFRVDGGSLPYWFSSPKGVFAPIRDGKVLFSKDIEIPLDR